MKTKYRVGDLFVRKCDRLILTVVCETDQSGYILVQDMHSLDQQYGGGRPIPWKDEYIVYLVENKKLIYYPVVK